MDREIPIEQRRRERRRRLTRIAIAAVIAVGALAWGIFAMRKGVRESTLKLSTADRGTIETTVNATGRVAPATEEIINSPITTKIVEVYCSAGDSVAAGTPLLLLDLNSTETELKRITDERTMKQCELENLRLNNNTFLNKLEMQIEVKEMAVNRLAAEVAKERRLDSIGTGTGDRVHEAELALATGRLELAQLRKELANERDVRRSDEHMKSLELEIYDRRLAETARLFEDAKIKAPRAATLTYISEQIGQQVTQGERVAVLSDLSHFKIEGEAADSYGERIAPGAPVVARLGGDRLAGRISRVTPKSENGVIAFTVTLERDDNPRLRSGLKTDIYVMCDERADVVRIANGPYYKGAGQYDLFVRTDPASSTLEKRKVTLGESNYEYVEVVSGIEPGESVATADMSEYRDAKTLKIN